mmetsp:Transcript_57921/g.125790  ORF Transcript_57921/g.125790 Transcript_57921/m.125790 type:complete len:200 (-) Transcript_57921:675-1274(-)
MMESSSSSFARVAVAGSALSSGTRSGAGVAADAGADAGAAAAEGAGAEAEAEASAEVGAEVGEAGSGVGVPPWAQDSRLSSSVTDWPPWLLGRLEAQHATGRTSVRTSEPDVTRSGLHASTFSMPSIASETSNSGRALASLKVDLLCKACRSSITAIAAWPCFCASMSAVQPRLSAMEGSAQSCNRPATMSAWPRAAAQ